MLLAVAAFLSCQREEIVETPALKISDDTDQVVLEYGQTLDYLIDLAYFQYSATANSTNEILKASLFQVRSNCSWKIVPVGETPDWIRPFPDSGDKEGVFCFLVQRNNDQSDSRQVVYQVVINDGAQDITVGGTIIVTQAAAVDFLKTNQAKLDINKEGGNASVTVTSNLPWTYTLVPDEDYASPDIEEWIEDRTELKEESVSQTLRFRFSDNSEGSLRGAILTITPEGYPDLVKKIPITQFGLDVEVTGFPVSWICSNKAGFPTWPSASNPVPTVQASQGKGTITFHRADIPGLDRTASTCDISGDNPRVNGAWPGDYWEFNVPSPISAGSLIKLSFEGRISGSGIKHWRLEYKDGTEWKIAGTPLTAEIAADDVWPAETITYTHDMAPGGTGDEYNKIITQIVRYTETTDEVAFRFYAASNVIASSGLRMAKPTTASTRLDNSKPSTTTNDATISCVASGGEIKLADIDVKGVDKGYLLFDGAPKAPAAIAVTASDDFTVTADVPWLHITQGMTGKADEETAVEITCDESTLSDPREGNVIVQAGVTRKYIPVIQSAAGQELDPFISLSKGNKATLDFEAGTLSVTVQTNTDVDVTAPEWITVTPVDSKALVEWKEYELAYLANEAEDERTGAVRFFNDGAGIEAVLHVTQAGKPKQKVYFKDNFEWLAPYTAAYKAAKPDATLDPVGSNLASHDQPNLWNDQTNYKVVTDDLYERGYIDLNPTAKTLYMQENYFKMGATNKHTGLQLPPCDFEGETPVNVELTFDWCAHMTGTGKIDATTITVELVGGGTCADSGIAFSKEITTTQEQGQLAWQHASVILVGVTKDTRIKIYPTHYADGAGASQQRWHLDNILIQGSDYVPPVSFPVVWSFKEPGDDWVAGTDFQILNPTGSWVMSDTHDGKLSVNRAGETLSSDPTYKNEGTIGCRLLSTGVYLNDYWLFEVDNVVNPAGTYGIKYKACSSAAGPKFFVLEYSLDGSNWTAVNTKTTTEKMTDTAETQRDVTYTYALSYTSNTANEVLEINETFHLDAITAPTKLLIRSRVCDTMALARNKELNGANHGGTNRVGGAAEISFTKD